MTSPLLLAPGAVAATGVDEGVAAHYGEPLREQRALESGKALVDLSHMGVLTVTGADRLTWLHAITSQHLTGLEPGTCTELLVLDPHGRIEHAAAVVDDGDTTWLLTEGSRAQGLVQYLESMRFAMRVDVAAREDLAVLGSSADAGELAESLKDDTVQQWRDPWPVTGAGSTRYGPPDHQHPGAQWQAALWVVPRETLAKYTGARLAGVWAWEALRVAAYRPRLAMDVDERAIPHELDWLRSAVHLEKGCYRGQETIARVFTMGRPPRRLVLLHLDGSEHTLPDAGAELIAGGRAVGKLTTVVRHHELGPIALGLIKRNTDPEAELTAGGVAASQETIVSPEGFGTNRPPPRDTPKPNPALRRRP